MRSLDPVSLPLTLILLSSTIGFPFFFHLMRGLYLPVTVQNSDSPLPSLTVLYLGLMKTDGAVPVRRKTQSYSCKDLTIQSNHVSLNDIYFTMKSMIKFFLTNVLT